MGEAHATDYLRGVGSDGFLGFGVVWKVKNFGFLKVGRILESDNLGYVQYGWSGTIRRI